MPSPNLQPRFDLPEPQAKPLPASLINIITKIKT
jgi:hypothetical protein